MKTILEFGHFNNLLPAELERLALLLEEMSEVGEVIGKIIRHGYVGEDVDKTYYNREDLEREIADVSLVLNLMMARGDIDSNNIERHYQKKKMVIQSLLHHNTIDF